ncbi:Major facilitator, sugar transporter-like [Dillenia turbinata]|uniref:Major facilitator, sugar transporter-like n=1 Tax=Dillenia turbinata TaxID=194707 RepID=A0AAN8ZNV1_9MAGN
MLPAASGSSFLIDFRFFFDRLIFSIVRAELAESNSSLCCVVGYSIFGWLTSVLGNVMPTTCSSSLLQFKIASSRDSRVDGALEIWDLGHHVKKFIVVDNGDGNDKHEVLFSHLQSQAQAREDFIKLAASVSLRLSISKTLHTLLFSLGHSLQVFVFIGFLFHAKVGDFEQSFQKGLVLFGVELLLVASYRVSKESGNIGGPHLLELSRYLVTPVVCNRYSLRRRYQKGGRTERQLKNFMAKEQLQVLNALDVAKTQWYHFTAIVVAGMGFFTDAYDLFCISLVTKLLGRIYYHVDGAEKPGSLPPGVSAAVNGVAFCGTLAGQLFFGWLGDKLGRKKVYGMTLLLMVICSIASGLSFGHTPSSVMATLCFFRFWLGFGIGGDYPLSATIMSEYANKRTRGAFIAAVFAMQGFGILAGGVFAIIVSAAFKARFPAPAYEVDPIASTIPQADYAWRIILMVGALPAALTYYWRTKMPETARYTALVAKNAKQAASDMSKVLQVEVKAEPEKLDQLASKTGSSYGLFSSKFFARHGLHLLGTCSTWFLLDIAFYSQNLFQKDIFSAIGWIPNAKTMNAMEEVHKIARAQTLIALCSTVPGYWFTVAFIDRIGRFAIQLLGFFFMTVFMFALAIPYDHWTRKENRIGFVIMYSLTFFFANFGPNATTFVVPAEIFPARFRSTCHGISAASGKLGAMVGAFGFLYLSQNQDKSKAEHGYPAGIGMRNSLIMLSVVNLLGLFFTFLVPESKGKSLEEISGEQEDTEEQNSAQNDKTLSV